MKSVEGRVLLKFTVDKMGFAKDPKVVSSKGGSAFGDAALKSADSYRYAPKFVDGEPVQADGVATLVIFEMLD